jgi:hypothetical protein
VPDLDALTTEVQNLRTETAALLSLAAGLKVRVDALLERVAGMPAANHSVDFNGSSWRAIARAILELDGRRPALIQGALARGGRPCDRARNGRAANNGRPAV